MSYIGTTKIGKMYLGNTEIAKAYLGTDLVFQKDRPQPVQHTLTVNLSSYDSVDKAYRSISNASRAYTDTSSTNYASVTLVRGDAAYTYIYFKFDTSSIPANATIDSVACQAKITVTNNNSSIIASKGAKMCSGTTEKTDSVTVTAVANVRTFTTGTWTRQEVSDVRIKCYATRGSENTTTDYNIRMYGAELTIVYTA